MQNLFDLITIILNASSVLFFFNAEGRKEDAEGRRGYFFPNSYAAVLPVKTLRFSAIKYSVAKITYRFTEHYSI
jgi:hypothetical protein